MKRPGVQIVSYDEILNLSSWKIAWEDRENPGVSGSVEITNGSVHVTLENPSGKDRSGRRRPVRLAQGSPTPTTPPSTTPPGRPPNPYLPSSTAAPPLPPRDALRRWRGNFLNFPNYEFAFMYPAWDARKQSDFRLAYRAAGHTHLPIGIWGAYTGRGSFDFRSEVDQLGFLLLLRELRMADLLPVVFVHTDAISTRAPFTRADLTTWASHYLPSLLPYVACWVTGWEFNQIDQSSPVYWTGKGSEHLAWARSLRSILGPDALLYAHFSPERITGYPNYPDHSGPQDEASWWKDHNPLNGLLYQRRPDEPERFVLAHTLGGEAVDSSIDVGDVYRISGDRWGLKSQNLDFVFFEHSREFSRWERLTNAVKDHPLVAGFC